MDLTVVTSFIGTLLAFALTKTVERVVSRRLEAAELARDALVDLLSGLTATEVALDSLLAATMPNAYAEHAETPSGWDLPAPSIKLERLLGIFDDEHVHRFAILYYERYDHFTKRSKQHESAFYWLLDHPDIDWRVPQAAERVALMRVARAEMLADAKIMMQYGYGLAELLLERARRPNLTSMTRPSLAAFLEHRFAITEEEMRLRRAFYSLTDVPFVYDPGISYTLLTWNDAVAIRLRGLGGVLALSVEFTTGAGEQRTETVLLPPLVEVAVPESVARTIWVGWLKQSHALEGPRFAPANRPNDGDGRRRVSLEPKDVDTVQRLLGSGSAAPRLPR